MEGWEQRFDAVVRETEENLAKVKGTLQATPAICNYDSQGKTNKKYCALFSNSNYGNNPNYHKELWRQEEEIQQLRQKVSLLEHSNTHYQQEARLLQSQVQSLKKSRLPPSTPPPFSLPSLTTDHVVREFEKFRIDVERELVRLKEGIRQGNMNKGTDNMDTIDKIDRHNKDNFILLRKDIDTCRLKQAEDFQELKSDLESLRNRIVKVEFEVKSVMSDNKECLKRCQRLASETSLFSESVVRQNKSTSSQLQSLNDNCCSHLPILRDTVSDLEGRLSSLEETASKISSFTPASLKDSTSTRGSSFVKLDQDVVGTVKNTDMILDEFDNLSLLSDQVDVGDKSAGLSETETYKKQNNSLTETFSLAGDTLSMAGDLISGISGILSDDDIL